LIGPDFGRAALIADVRRTSSLSDGDKVGHPAHQ